MVETSHKPLAGKRIVVTRALEQSRPLVEALRDAGADPQLLPLMAFAPPDDFSDLDNCLRNPRQFDWVFFTSQNAVRVVQERSTTLGRSLSQVFSDVQIAAVGPATADFVHAAGLPVAYVSKVHNGVAMAGELSLEVKGKHVFLPRSDRANPDLIEALKRLNAQVTPVVAYKTVAPEDASLHSPEKLLNGADAILFFSPSAVHHLREILGSERFLELSNRAVFVAIGPVSEKALQSEGVRRILVASDTTIAASIATLTEFFSKAGLHLPAGAKQG